MAGSFSRPLLTGNRCSAASATLLDDARSPVPHSVGTLLAEARAVVLGVYRNAADAGLRSMGTRGHSTWSPSAARPCRLSWVVGSVAAVSIENMTDEAH